MKRLPFFPAAILTGLCFAALTLPARADEDEVAAAARAAKKPLAPPTTRGTQMEYGPMLATMVALPGKGPDRMVATKGVIVRLGKDAAVCFDADTLRLAAGWTGSFLDLKETNLGSYKGYGVGAAVIAGTLGFRTEDAPGWSLSDDFADARPAKAGPLPRSVVQYWGWYRHGERVVFAYRFAGCEILESPTLLEVGGKSVFARQFTLGKAAQPLHLLLPAAPAQTRVLGADLKTATVRGRTALAIPAHTQPLHFTVLIASEPLDQLAAGAASPDLTPLTKPGAGTWPAIILAGTRAEDSAGYVVDTIPLPEENPWKSWMRLTGIDFFRDGRAAVSTLNGDVWLVSGLDAKLDQVTWKRFATGLFEPLGLKIVKEQIHVLGRDQITRLRDANGDGEADFYECFNHDRALYPNYHAFAFDLQADAAGNLYYVVGGNQLGAQRNWHASLFKVSADGAKTEPVASGFRAPNGMGIGPRGEIVVSDNEGHWIPASKINRVKPGGFYGHMADPRVDPKAVAPASYDPPLCWIPKALDNSSGGQVWAPAGGKWGPFDGHLLHTSYGQSALFAVLEQTVGDVAQGGVVKFPLKFDSGIVRARFNPADGQLYVVGLKGWQTNAGRDGCLQRVRYTGQPVPLPTALRVAKDAITLTFPVALDRNAAVDPQNFAISQWNYKWHSTYGSPDVSVADPKKNGRDPVEVSAAQLSADGRSVTLKVPGLQPVMQMLIKLNLQTADGAPISSQVAHTIHQIPAQ